jgi:SdpC family antimicrobial peptide
MKRSLQMRFLSASMAFLTFSTLGAGCGPGDADTQSPGTMARQQAVSGRELYKGMIFGVGPGAAFFDEIWQRPEIQAQMARPGVQDKRELAAERLAAKIHEMDPSFFDRFAQDLRSGNHLVIDRLITETKDRTFAATQALGKEDGVDVSGSAVAMNAKPVVYIETAVAVVVAAIVFIVITAIDVTPVVEGSEASALRRDAWVDLLANKSFDAQ